MVSAPFLSAVSIVSAEALILSPAVLVFVAIGFFSIVECIAMPASAIHVAVQYFLYAMQHDRCQGTMLQVLCCSAQDVALAPVIWEPREPANRGVNHS